MTINPRPLPCAIVTMMLLVGVKTAGLVHAIGIGNPAHATEQVAKPEAHEAKPEAHEAKPDAKVDPKADKAPAKPTAAAAAPAVPAPEPVSDAERATLQDLRSRRREIEGRAAKLDEREALLTAAERRLNERVEQLAALQTKLEQLEKQRQQRDEANWQGLVKTYEAMRPRDAAVIFNDLDSAILIQVLDRMKENKAAPILAAMTPDRARAATTQLAQYRTHASAAPTLNGGQSVNP